MICKQCGTENNETAKFCRACGAKLEVPAPPARNFCTDCGTENQPDALFCKNCGNKLKDDAYTYQSEPQADPGSAAPRPEPEMKRPEPEMTQPDPEPVRVETEFRAAPQPQPQSSFEYQSGQGTGGYGQTIAGAAGAAAAGHPSAGTSSGGGFGAAKESLGPKLVELFRMSFKSPVKYMQKAVKYEDYWLTTVFVALIADLIFAVIPSIALASAFSGYGGSGYGSSVVGVFFGIFIAMVVIEGLCILAMFAAEKIFGCSCTLKNVVAVTGPVYFLTSLAMIVVLLFAMTGSGGMIVIAYIISVPLMIMAMVLSIKAHEVVSGLKDAKMVYAYVAYAVIAIVFIVIVMAIAGVSLRNGAAGNFSIFLNNLLNNYGGY